MISAKAAVETARQGIERYGLDKTPDVAAALAAGHVADPVLVKRLDMPEHDYYLVTWADEQGIRLIAQVDAVTGALASAAPLQQPLPRLMIDASEARRLVIENLDPDVIGEPQIVWYPCRESASSFLPFYQIHDRQRNGFRRRRWCPIHELDAVRQGRKSS